jgi:hypothetical protein
MIITYAGRHVRDSSKEVDDIQRGDDTGRRREKREREANNK